MVVEVNDEVVGFCLMRSFPETARHNHAGEIDLMAVRKEFQGRGIGKAMMNALLEVADNWLQLERVGLLV
ncbi:MAG: GNAT family N-acetyltransferase [Paracoccaceae bacterium]